MAALIRTLAVLAAPLAAAPLITLGFAANDSTATLAAAAASRQACQQTTAVYGIQASPQPTAPPQQGQRWGQWNPAQVANMKTIIAVGKGMNVPPAGWVVALATAMQESSLINIDYGDRAGPDSRGLFQQRDPWGPLADRMDPARSTAMFFKGGSTAGDGYHEPGLLDIPGWQSLPVTVAAQTVQRSAFPDAYAKWEADARAAVTVFGGVTAIAPAPGSDTLAQTACDPGPAGDQTGSTAPPLPANLQGDLRTALTAMVGLVGRPYIWGGTTSRGTDCSGLIYYGWARAGHPMAVRTAAQMYGVSTRIAPGSEQPGDLIFSEFGTRVSGPGHVVVVLDPARHIVVEAPHTGALIRTRTYTISGDARIGRLTTQAFTK